MPSPTPIRKEILQALDEHIIPALWRQATPLGYVAAPFDFPPGIHARLINPVVPRAVRANVDFPVQTRWPRANLHSNHYPYLGFLYEGAADERTLITTAQAAQFHLVKGIYAIRWHAPGVLLFPAGVAHSGGEPTFWEDTAPMPSMKILWISLWTELLLHTHINNPRGQRSISHSLQINDPAAITLARLFLQELEDANATDQRSATAILLAMMLRLQKSLRASQSKIANTARSPLPPGSALLGERAREACRDVAIHIEMRLHEPLSLPGIAQSVHLSPAHLNRIFHRLHGIPVMRYVRARRIAAAKDILKQGDENIAEIAQLVGFKRANLFCRAFRQETGLTPGQFRRQMARGGE